MNRTQLKEKLRKLYFEGKTRKEAMEACNLATNQIASQSTQLKLHWSWPLENRKSGQPPDILPPAPKVREARPGKMVTISRPVPQNNVAQAPASPKTPPAVPATAQKNPLTIPPRRNWGPPTGWVSSAEKWQRGFGEPGSAIVGETAEEKYLYEKLYR